jgi:ESS family glutamate:Na+ symporter
MITPFEMDFFLAFGFTGLCLFIGVLVRAKIPFLQRFLVPACMSGGLAGMILMNLGLVPLDAELFHAIAYHFFIISFISIGLTGGRKTPGQQSQGKTIARGALWMGLINGASMSTQALLACLLMLILGLVGTDLPVQFGLFLPLGFTQGPGQALAVGKVWEATVFVDAVTIGLAFSAIGFFFALFVGIPLVNWGIRRGLTKMGDSELPRDFRCGYYDTDEACESLGNMTTHPANVDALAFQASAIGMVYGLTYIGYWGVGQIFGQVGEAAWGFFFFFGMVVGLLFRLGMAKVGAGRMLDAVTQNRLTGLAVDILVASTLISVKLSVVWDHFVPLLIVALAGGAWTTFYMLYFGRRCSGFGFERMVVQYGCNTGTVSTGLVLLRVVDPHFKTTVALETGMYSIFAAPFIMGTMLVVLYSPQWGLGVFQQMGIYAGLAALAFGLLKLFRLWGPKQW